MQGEEWSKMEQFHKTIKKMKFSQLNVQINICWTYLLSKLFLAYISKEISFIQDHGEKVDQEIFWF